MLRVQVLPPLFLEAPKRKIGSFSIQKVIYVNKFKSGFNPIEAEIIAVGVESRYLDAIARSGVFSKEDIAMKKICAGCGEERDAEKDFNWKYKDRGIRSTRCKSCQSRISKCHYQENKQAYIARAHARDGKIVADNQRRLAAYLACHPCVDCGLADIRVLEFDHVRGAKKDNIGRMLEQGCSWATIEAEITKCEVRCVNCHRIKTSERSGFWRHLGNFS